MHSHIVPFQKKMLKLFTISDARSKGHGGGGVFEIFFCLKRKRVNFLDLTDNFSTSNIYFQYLTLQYLNIFILKITTETSYQETESLNFFNAFWSLKPTKLFLRTCRKSR